MAARDFRIVANAGSPLPLSSEETPSSFPLVFKQQTGRMCGIRAFVSCRPKKKKKQGILVHGMRKGRILTCLTPMVVTPRVGGRILLDYPRNY